MNEHENEHEHDVETDEDLSLQHRINNFVKKNVFDIAIVLICVARIVFGLAEIQKTGKTVVGIIADGTITFVFSMILSRLLEGKGLKAGEDAKSYQDSLKDYKAAKSKAGSYIPKLDEWCKKHTEKNYKAKMTSMLLPLGMTYDQYIKHEYDETNFTDEQKKHYAKLKKVKVQRITTASLMSGEIECNREIDYESATKRAFMRRSTGSDTLSKIILSVVFGYFTLPPIAQWDWSGAVWALLHTALMLGLSVVKYLNAYNFINEEMRAKLEDKTTKLNLFIKEQSENGNERNCGNGAKEMENRV